jgi:anti-sigma regulatory factor (Ser/Thr protein kinase)
LLEQLTQVAGDDWEQEEEGTPMRHWKQLAEFTVPSAPGNERYAMQRTGEVLAGENLPPARLERLKTAVAETTMNAMEHGNRYQVGQDVRIQVAASRSAVCVRITDQGGHRAIPEPTTPDIGAKLAGLQSPRGWGLFLIRNLVDEVNTSSDADHYTVELVLNRHKEN